jgi:hypothetical protein
MPPHRLVVPSAEHVLVSAWLGSVRDGAWEDFASWWDRVSAGDDDGPWRIDRQVLSRAGAEGAARVRLVLGADGEDGTPHAGTLSAADVRLVELLMAELESVGLTGRNAADLVHGAAEGLQAERRGRSAPPLPAPLVARVATWGAGVLDAARAAGVEVVGDPALLDWPVGAEDPEAAQVDVGTALDLAFGVLDRVRSWPGREAAR